MPNRSFAGIILMIFVAGTLLHILRDQRQSSMNRKAIERIMSAPSQQFRRN